MFCVRKFVSQKSGKMVTALVYDAGYKQFFVSFDTLLLSEVLGKSPQELFDLPAGDYPIVT